MLGFNKKTQDASPQENTGGENKVFHFIKTHKKRCIAVVAAAAVLVAVIVPRRSRSASADLAYTQEKLGRRDIVNVYDGSGTINAADSYTVKSLVTGTVLTADFELGDSIEKGDVLYTIDISDVENNLASAQLSVEQAQRNYDDIADMQNVRTRISGEVSSFAVAAGDAVQAGQTVATIRDTSVMLLAVDFPAAEAQSFVVGQAAQVMPDTTFETLNGTIRSVSGADPAGDASLMTCTVTIAVPNAGSLTTAQAAVAQVNGVSSLNSAHFTYQREETVVAAASGTVSELCVKEGSTVRQDDVILRITGKDLDKQTKNAADSLRAAELQMSSAEKTISHYTIDAPISGTIVDKKVKAGDKLSANDTAMQNLCTIYDMSYLEMKLNVDELKIRSLEVGQEVDITADAVPGETYKGVISSILGVVVFAKNLIIGIIISVYLLAMKEQSLARCCKLLYGVLSERAANLVMRGTRRTDEIFSGFVRGKLLDSLIIGILCFIGGSILNLPYTPLVSVVVGVTNIIPFFGPFLGAIPSAFLILLVSPKQCLIFIIFVIVLQQFDGNILGPKILGSATGISSFWVVVTILLGGGFFGVLGMFLGVPVFACLQELVKHLIDRRLTQRNMPTEAYAYVGRDKRPPQETAPEKTEDSPKNE